MGAGREFEGKDLSAALKEASRALGAPPDSIAYELLTEGRRGVFGIGARKVRIWVDLPETDGSPVHPDPGLAVEASPEDWDWAQRTLEAILSEMGFELEMSASAGRDGGVRIDLQGSDARYLLARDGEALAALQFLLNRMAQKSGSEIGRIQLECQGYRDRRDRALIELAREAAGQVARTGLPRTLRAMNPYERRLVHLTVREFPGLVSLSEGGGPQRRVRISLEEPKGRA
jgi:spoIIIJ-associated protein